MTVTLSKALKYLFSSFYSGLTEINILINSATARFESTTALIPSPNDSISTGAVKNIVVKTLPSAVVLPPILMGFDRHSRERIRIYIKSVDRMGGQHSDGMEGKRGSVRDRVYRFERYGVYSCARSNYKLSLR